MAITKDTKYMYKFKTLSKIEKELGYPISRLDGIEEMELETAAILIWGAIIHENKELTVEDVMDLIDESEVGLAEIMEKSGKALTKYFEKQGKK